MKVPLTVLLALGMAVHRVIAGDPAPVYGNNETSGRYYAINGIRLYCEIYGSGPAVLMIHGNGGSIAQFAHTIPYFATKHRVIVADSRAQGKSRDPGPALTFEMMADDCAALLDSLQVKSADVIGYSDGGIVALLLALRHPEKVRRLAATGANLRPDASAFAPGVWESAHQQYERDKDRPRSTEKERNDWKLFMLDWLEPNIPSTALSGIKCPSLSSAVITT